MDADAAYSGLSALDRVQQAEGGFSKKVLTETSGRLNDQRPIDHLAADEHLAFVLYHHQKGLRIIQPDGSEQTPHHQSMSNSTGGSRYLLITDRRICYLAGLDSRDEVRNFAYDQLTDVTAESGIFTNHITITTVDGTAYRFSDSGHHSQDIEPAAQYIKERIDTDDFGTRGTEETEIPDIESPATEDGPASSESFDAFSTGTGVLAGLSSVVLSGVLFAVVAGIGFSFPVSAFDFGTYGESMTTPLWGAFIAACSLGTATATTVWYPLRAGPQIRDELPSPITIFVVTLLCGFVLFGLVGFLRIIITLILLLLLMLLMFVGPLLLLYGLLKTNRAVLLSSLALLVFWIIGFTVVIVTVDDSVSVQSNLFGIFMIGTLTAILPAIAGEMAADDAIEMAREQRSALAELDTVLQEIDHEYLASLGLELQYQRAGFDIETTDSRLVFDDPAKEQNLTPFIDYHRAVARFEQTASERSDPSGEPPAVLSRLCVLLNQHTPTQAEDVEQHQLSTLERAIDIVEGYHVLQENDNQTAISGLDNRLQSVLEETPTRDDSSTQASSGVLDELEDIASWLTNRVRESELATRRTTILEEWEKTVTPAFGSEIDVIRPLPEGVEGSDLSLADTEAQLDDAERIIALATTVEEFKSETDAPFIEELTAAVREYLIETTQSGQDLSESVALFDDGVGVVRLSLAKQVEYPTVPFGELAQQLVAAIEEGSITSQDITDAEQVLSGVEKILSFLETVDSSHPSVPVDDWHDSIDTALRNGSMEILKPPLKAIERMGDTLWERKHLHLFSWADFEHLIGSLYEKRGYRTNVTQQANDKGVDVWAFDNGNPIAIQVKQFSSDNKVGRPDVQKLASTIAKGDADRAIVVTSSEFTKPARTYAADFGKKMELVDGDDLIRMLSSSDIPPPV